MFFVAIPCPECGSLDCRKAVTKYEIREDVNKLLQGEWPCEWSEEKRKRLDAMLAQPSANLGKINKQFKET